MLGGCNTYAGDYGHAGGSEVGHIEVGTYVLLVFDVSEAVRNRMDLESGSVISFKDMKE